MQTKHAVGAEGAGQVGGIQIISMALPYGARRIAGGPVRVPADARRRPLFISFTGLYSSGKPNLECSQSILIKDNRYFKLDRLGYN